MNNRKPKILVVEETKELIRPWTGKLTNQGFDVLTAKDGPAALEQAALERPDLVVVDLPANQSEKTVKKLRENKWANRVPVIFLNSWGDPEIYAQYEEGIDQHLAYNWSFEEVVRMVKQKLALV